MKKNKIFYDKVLSFKSLNGRKTNIIKTRYWKELLIVQEHCSKCGAEDVIVLSVRDIKKLNELLDKIQNE